MINSNDDNKETEKEKEKEKEQEKNKEKEKERERQNERDGKEEKENFESKKDNINDSEVKKIKLLWDQLMKIHNYPRYNYHGQRKMHQPQCNLFFDVWNNKWHCLPNKSINTNTNNNNNNTKNNINTNTRTIIDKKIDCNVNLKHNRQGTKMYRKKEKDKGKGKGKGKEIIVLPKIADLSSGKFDKPMRILHVGKDCIVKYKKIKIEISDNEKEKEKETEKKEETRNNSKQQDKQEKMKLKSINIWDFEESKNNKNCPIYFGIDKDKWQLVLPQKIVAMSPNNNCEINKHKKDNKNAVICNVVVEPQSESNQIQIEFVTSNDCQSFIKAIDNVNRVFDQKV